VRHRAVWKETQDRLLHVANESLLDRQSDECGYDALRDRGHVVAHLRVVRIKVGIQHQLAVAYDLDTMHGYLVFADVIEHLGERSRIESNFFGQGRGPFGRLRFFRPTRSSVRDDAQRQREHGHRPSSVAVLPRVARLPGAAPRQLNPVWAVALRRVDGEAGVLQQLAEREFQIVHGWLSVVSRPLSIASYFR